MGVRDSKNPTGPALVFAPNEWDASTSDVRSGASVAEQTRPPDEAEPAYLRKLLSQ
ncbi:DUF397 domain-containing protein [Nocardia miyunensis]|uniref:DUF397 domain-containing protein n=1 Tax=Nocardia miyunensis TaxID=282684 RepID=UPI000A0262A3